MTEILKRIAAVISLVALIGIGSYAFGVRAADTTVTNPSMQNGTSQSTTTTPSGSQTNVIVPQSTTGYVAAPVATPVVTPGESLGSLIVLDGLFSNNGIATDGSLTSTQDLAGLIAVNNLLTPYGYAGYAATPAVGGVGYGAGDTLGGLIVLNGLFGDNGISSNDNIGMSDSARGLAGLLAVNNLTSPYVPAATGYAGTYATPAAGYAATPAVGGVGYGAGDTLGGLIVLNGLFGDTGTTIIDDPAMSAGAQDLAGLIAVQNTTSPIR